MKVPNIVIRGLCSYLPTGGECLLVLSVWGCPVGGWCPVRGVLCGGVLCSLVCDQELCFLVRESSHTLAVVRSASVPRQERLLAAYPLRPQGASEGRPLQDAVRTPSPSRARPQRHLACDGWVPLWS